jgi:N-acetylneuraminic acid mutarotase
MRNNKFDLTRKNVDCADLLTFYIVGGTSGTLNDIFNFFYKYSNGVWTELSNLPIPLHRHASVLYNGDLYVIGGRETSNITTNLMYKYSNGLWQLDHETMVIKRDNFGCCVYNNTIYAFGGFNGSLLDTIEKYDGSSWIQIGTTNLSTVRSRTSAVVYNNNIYILGGITNSGRTNTVDIYNAATDAITSGPIMPYSVEFHASVVYNNDIYVIGGNSGTITSSVIKYDGTSWSSVASLNTPRYGHTAVVVNGSIYVFGGNTGTQTVNTIEKYDGTVWTVVPFTMPYKSLFHTTN